MSPATLFVISWNTSLILRPVLLATQIVQIVMEQQASALNVTHLKPLLDQARVSDLLQAVRPDLAVRSPLVESTDVRAALGLDLPSNVTPVSQVSPSTVQSVKRSPVQLPSTTMELTASLVMEAVLHAVDQMPVQHATQQHRLSSVQGSAPLLVLLVRLEILSLILV